MRRDSSHRRCRSSQSSALTHPPFAAWRRAWVPAAYASFRDCTVAEAAAALAAAGRLAALPLLLQRHPRALVPAALDALGSAAETLDAKQYMPVLRQVGASSTCSTGIQTQTASLTALLNSLPAGGDAVQILALQQPPELARPADWVECAASAEGLKQRGEYALLLATEAMCAASSGWHPPSLRQLAAWLCQRAQQVDAATGEHVHDANVRQEAV